MPSSGFGLKPLRRTLRQAQQIVLRQADEVKTSCQAGARFNRDQTEWRHESRPRGRGRCTRQRGDELPQSVRILRFVHYRAGVVTTEDL